MKISWAQSVTRYRAPIKSSFQLLLCNILLYPESVPLECLAQYYAAEVTIACIHYQCKMERALCTAVINFFIFTNMNLLHSEAVRAVQLPITRSTC